MTKVATNLVDVKFKSARRAPQYDHNSLVQTLLSLSISEPASQNVSHYSTFSSPKSVTSPAKSIFSSPIPTHHYTSFTSPSPSSSSSSSLSHRTPKVDATPLKSTSTPKLTESQLQSSFHQRQGRKFVSPTKYDDSGGDDDDFDNDDDIHQRPFRDNAKDGEKLGVVSDKYTKFLSPSSMQSQPVPLSHTSSTHSHHQVHGRKFVAPLASPLLSSQTPSSLSSSSLPSSIPAASSFKTLPSFDDDIPPLENDNDDNDDDNVSIKPAHLKFEQHDDNDDDDQEEEEEEEEGEEENEYGDDNADTEKEEDDENDEEKEDEQQENRDVVDLTHRTATYTGVSINPLLLSSSTISQFSHHLDSHLDKLLPITETLLSLSKPVVLNTKSILSTINIKSPSPPPSSSPLPSSTILSDMSVFHINMKKQLAAIELAEEKKKIELLRIEEEKKRLKEEAEKRAEQIRKLKEEEEEKKRQEQLKRDADAAAKKQADVAAAQVQAQAAKQQAALDAIPPHVKEHHERMMKLKMTRESADRYKDVGKKWTITIKSGVNKIANTIKSIKNTFASVRQSLESCKSNIDQYSFSHLLILDSLITNAKKNTPFRYALIALLLSALDNNFSDLFIAYITQQCCYLIPSFPPHTDDVVAAMDNMQYERVSDDDTTGQIVGNVKFESEESYFSRLSSLSSLYAAFSSLTLPGGRTHPFGIDNIWLYICRLLNIKARAGTATVILAMMKIAGSSLQKEYKKQFLKLFCFIGNEYINTLPTKTPARKHSKEELFNWISTYGVKDGSGRYVGCRDIPEPEGKAIPQDVDGDQGPIYINQADWGST